MRTLQIRSELRIVVAVDEWRECPEDLEEHLFFNTLELMRVPE